MDNLNYSFDSFAQAVKRGAALELEEDGRWQVSTSPIAWIGAYMPGRAARQLKLIRSFTAYLDRLEAHPIEQNRSAGSSFDYTGCLLAAEALVNSSALYSSYHVKEALILLKQRFLALQYRLEPKNGGFDREAPSTSLVQKIVIAAQEWKKSEAIFWHLILSEKEIELAADLARYPLFANLALSDYRLQKDLFRWLFRDRLPLEVYIQYPRLKDRLSRSLMTGRISRIGGHILKIEVIGGVKVVTLPFEGRPVSLLSDSTVVHLKQGYSLTIGEVFKIFSQKRIEVGTLEFFSDGIENWNWHRLASFDPDKKCYVEIDLERQNWWEAFPLLEEISLEEAKACYGSYLDGVLWNFSIRASRHFRNLNFDRSHAYLEVAIPKGNGRYAIYPFGKFATRFPRNDWDALTSFSIVTPAAIAYPDENVFFSHRQHVGFSYEATPDEGRKIMAVIKEDILKARRSQLVFQIESENCGKWIHTLLASNLGREKVPNLFRLHLLETEPTGFVKWVFNTVRLMPESWHQTLIGWIHLVFGAWKGVWLENEQGERIKLTLQQTEFWGDTVVYLPAMLHYHYESRLHRYRESNARRKMFSRRK